MQYELNRKVFKEVRLENCVGNGNDILYNHFCCYSHIHFFLLYIDNAMVNCDYCDYSTEDLSNLNRHFKSVHLKDKIECYYCEGNEIKCFFVIKIFFLAITKRKFYKKSKSKHHIDMNKTLLRKILQSFGKKLQKKLIKNKFYLYGACSLYEITIAILLIIINYYIFAKWYLSMPNYNKFHCRL